MILSKTVAAKMASLLLQIKSVKLNLQEPFTWSSGWKSPIYCDNRISLSYPEIRTFIREELAHLIRKEYADAGLIAGVATAGIAHGALAADLLETPFCYVRSTAKGHGLQNQIEGLALPGQKAVVVEDLISTGGSSLNAVAALRNAGCEILGLVAIFTYGFPDAEKKFNAADCSFFTLTDYEALIAEALSQNIINASELYSLQQWRLAPDKWEGLK